MDKVIQVLMLRNHAPSTGTYITLFVMPWVFGAIFHDSLFLFQAFSLVGLTLTVVVCYLLPLYLWSAQASKAVDIKLNFKESLQQIYEGDKMSKKESYVHPRNVEYSFEGSRHLSSESSRSGQSP